MTVLSEPKTSAHADLSPALTRLAEKIQHAAHFLPSQGPITAFVHHNTLHAFEDLPFQQAVLKGAEVYGCHPYWTESTYREKLGTGRIGSEDLQAVLQDESAEKPSQWPANLGTRLLLRQAVLQYPLHDGPAVNLRWVIADSNALDRFRLDAPPSNRADFINETRRWILRDFPHALPQRADIEDRLTEKAKQLSTPVRSAVEQTLDLCGAHKIQSWSDSVWESFGLHLNWRLCQEGVQATYVPAPPQTPNAWRHRDHLLALTGQDSDEMVNQTLIQFTATFLDQGFCHWALPQRDHGFFAAFVEMYSQPASNVVAWKKGLAPRLKQIKKQETSALESIAQSLVNFGVTEKDTEDFILRKLLALRGFAGMIWQLENGARVHRPLRPGSLIDFLAVRLLLEELAVGYLAAVHLDFSAPLSQLQSHCRQRLAGQPATSSADRIAFQVFELAQILGWSPKTLARLTREDWQGIIHELNAFDDFERRRIYHLAFERKYRTQALDAIMAHGQRLQKSDNASPTSTEPSFQLICCIDDREESFRRHLEEIDSHCLTYGAAGFFSVAMNFQGAADAYYSPLCPAVVVPKHFVRETVGTLFQKQATQRLRQRRVIGTVTQRVHLGSRTFAGGWFGTAVLGTLATFPLVARVLFPRATAKLRQYFGSWVRPPEITQVEFERTIDPPADAEDQIGYSIPEMADIVQRLLEDLGITAHLSRLVMLCGHGSSSLNNPHESAYNCGACAGGRGGPNARVFSRMANDPRVRRLLSQRHIVIPDTTVFVGGYHNTCDDSVTFYELELLPTTHRKDFQHALDVINKARARNAHERCRRFESAALNLSYDEALQHVEGRSEDLSQARPEYNHATNAMCLVGRREWSYGLYLDRRAFMQTYDSTQDDADGKVLNRILQAVIPVCGGISLEYYFSCVDHVGYGAGNKLPHNIVSLLGVMDGAASDLRPGLYRQMIEIHEPMRILFVIETNSEIMLRIIHQNPGIKTLCQGNWVQIAIYDPANCQMQVYQDDNFVPYHPQSTALDLTPSSTDWYRGNREHLKFASIGSKYQHQS